MDPLQRVQSIDIGFVDGPMLIKKLLTKNQYVINGVIDGIKKKKEKKKEKNITLDVCFHECSLLKIDDTMAKGNESINRNMRKFSNQRRDAIKRG